MKQSIVAAVLAASFACSVSAATITPMKGISLLYINGQVAEHKIASNEVALGNTQVVVQMDKKVGRGSSQSVYTSAPYVLTFSVTGEEIKINHPVARSKQEAEAVFRQTEPAWRVSQDGDSLAYSQEKLKGRDGLLPYMGMDELVAMHNQERNISFSKNGASLPVAAVTTAVVGASVSEDVDTPQTVKISSNLEQLQALYLSTSKAERKEFRKWMIDQE